MDASRSKKPRLHENVSNESRESSGSRSSSTSDEDPECWEDAENLEFRKIKKVFSTEIPSSETIQKAVEIVEAAAEREVANAQQQREDEFKAILHFFDKPDDPQPTAPFVFTGAVHSTVTFTYDDDRSLRIGSKCFEPIEENVDDDEEEIQLRNAPMLPDPSEQFQVEWELHHHFENGVHGYLQDKFEVARESLYRIMKEALEKFNEVGNPDALYYAMYQVFPNHGSQRQFSSLFPELSDLYTTDAVADANLEPWRPKTVETVAERIASLNLQTLADRENHIVGYIQKPNRNFNCGQKCYHKMSEELQSQLLVNHAISREGTIKLLVPKTTPIAYVSFFNALLMRKKEITGSDFCKEVGKNDTKDCEDWFKILLRYSRSKNVAQNISNPVQLRPLPAIVKKHIAKKVAGSVDLSRPCKHVGPCGEGANGCTCKELCSIYCQCDERCKLRHNGCACTDTCKIGKCPCISMAMECDKLTCGPCFHSTNPNGAPVCTNKSITMKLAAKVKVGQSEIAGAGLFLGESVEDCTYLGEYVGKRRDKEATDRNGNVDVFGISYVYGANEGTSIDARHVGNALRFINSDEQRQNCEAYGAWVECKFRIGIFTIRQAFAGEELFLNYRYTEEHKKRFFKPKQEKDSSDRNNDGSGPSTSTGKR